MQRCTDRVSNAVWQTESDRIAYQWRGAVVGREDGTLVMWISLALPCGATSWQRFAVLLLDELSVEYMVFSFGSGIRCNYV